ncbi:MAG TPA: DUF3341 domain-containing protein [Ginsengibacter sp.]|nr:DUF3341 domain-containing protein [Chitinophagaceae bacterium]MCW5915229.1 DUF3341 domain-containing protein [Chitinophagaceae bacterium]HRN71758.1 DUF3341 domain-containing protein [Ginsengibacter sp.]HRP16454.1 DUF3341 domain-containing protein [Ginsengibacter sp.]HRP43972.1 DUF3341 domain-containing protein [Ginsengibacter sp.]
MIKSFVVGTFEDEKVLFPAVKHVRKAGLKLHDVYTPYPVHGLDKAMGLRETSLHTAGFIYGLMGTMIAIGGMGWIFAVDWPLNFGGKPHFPLPAYIPITFELTVLLSGVGMVLTYCYLNQMMPGVKKHHFSPRATDDAFIMVIELTGKSNEEEIKKFLADNGAIEINTQVAEEGWWFGRYDREQTLYRSDEVLA